MNKKTIYQLAEIMYNIYNCNNQYYKRKNQGSGYQHSSKIAKMAKKFNFGIQMSVLTINQRLQ